MDPALERILRAIANQSDRVYRAQKDLDKVIRTGPFSAMVRQAQTLIAETKKFIAVVPK